MKALAAPFTINTMPEGTLKAFARARRDRRDARDRMAATARRCSAAFAKAGIDIDALAQKLQDEGAASFDKSWNDLMACIESKSAAMRKAS